MPEITAQEQLTEALAKGEAKVHPVEAPIFYATSVRIGFDSNDIAFTFQRRRPVQFLIDGSTTVDAAQLEAVAIVSMSPQTAKDILVLLEGQVSKYEDEWGTIETEFTRSRMKKSPKKSPRRAAKK